MFTNSFYPEETNFHRKFAPEIGISTSLVSRPCLSLPFFAPFGAPLPSAPPCIRHLRRPVTGADLHGAPDRVRAPHRLGWDTNSVSMGGLRLEPCAPAATYLR